MDKFKIQHSDKREEFIAGTLEQTQKLSGKDVEYFSQETGFTLLEKEAKIKYGRISIQRALSAAKLSMGVPLELREFYYTLGATPELAKAFASCQADAVYPEVLRAIKNVEILCDIGREDFCIGNLSKGFIFYTHSEHYGDKDRKIAFTEKIARSVITDDELEACENIIVLEKNAAATRLVSLGFSELSNSVIVTVGGNFNRAIWELTRRFRGTKNIIFMADGDVYGVDMLRTIKVGTEASRHLDYKFPKCRNPNIYLAGLFPSVGKDLDLPNDKEQKRPSQRPATRKRIAFLQRFGLVDQRDVETWLNDDKTYELESLSTHYKNNKGEPVGIAIYLVEYMRLHNIPAKPPLPPDEELEELFKEEAKEELKIEIEEKIKYPKSFWTLYYKLNDEQADLKRRIFNKLLPAYERALEKVTAKEIKYHIYKQFEKDPSRATYDLKAIAHKLKKRFNIIIDWAMEEFIKALDTLLEEWEGADFDTDTEFEPIHNEERTDFNEYDLILQRLGVDPKDAEKVREALEKRFK